MLQHDCSRGVTSKQVQSVPYAQAGWVPGTTLLLDLAFAAFPDNFGHWAEAILPVYNVLCDPAWPFNTSSGSRQIDTLILINLRREQLAVGSFLLHKYTLHMVPCLRKQRSCH